MMDSKDMLIVAIFTLITVMAWIAFDVYHAGIANNITTTEERLMTPLNPNFDDQVISNLQLRQSP